MPRPLRLVIRWQWFIRFRKGHLDLGAVVLTAIDRRFPGVFVACRHLFHTEEAVNDDFPCDELSVNRPLDSHTVPSVSICIILGCFHSYTIPHTGRESDSYSRTGRTIPKQPFPPAVWSTASEWPGQTALTEFGPLLCEAAWQAPWPVSGRDSRL